MVNKSRILRELRDFQDICLIYIQSDKELR